MISKQKKAKNDSYALSEKKLTKVCVPVARIRKHNSTTLDEKAMNLTIVNYFGSMISYI